ncbi:hypothetical protein DSO57_1001221 [Entomophthora muscae]|uniref:Uncharacterized protein n=2 Tax=Entomophthora muscae TaxID=34485 RepID=A0ACC2TW58_9FUNG|nr:hypothetical protein DSO57_1001211 [Entomophthora muscae]KAJ9079008.1 hypothetical protein DSO57_1001221 [Entomophthora muscae]
MFISLLSLSLFLPKVLGRDEAYNTTSRLAKRDSRIASEQGGVEWILECTVEKHTCEKVTGAVRLMSRFIENAIILEPIIIKLKFEKICDSYVGRCEMIAMCKTSHLIRVNEENQQTLYPQALYKQNDHNEQHYLKDYDMLITFDAYYDYYFPNDYPNTQGICEMDFMQILTHEVLHGLGFASSLHALTSDIFSPIPRVRRVMSSETELMVSFLFTEFDNHILNEKNSKPLKHYAAMLRELGPIYFKPGQDYKTLTQNQPHYKIFKELSSIFTHAYFNASSNIKVYLKTPSIFSSMSLSHIDSSTYKNTRDETMMAKSGSGVGLHDLFHDDAKWLTSPFGPKTLAILATLGYRINPSPDYERSMESHYASFFDLPHDKTNSFFRWLSHFYICRKTIFGN